MGTSRNLKSTHIYVPLVEQLKAEGHDVELIFFKGVPNRELRFYQAQADIVVDMLTFGWFGANVREALMLGKPVVCYLRPEWLDDMRREIPGYVDELPVVSATPETVHEVLAELVSNRDKRIALGRRSREFAVGECIGGEATVGIGRRKRHVTDGGDMARRETFRRCIAARNQRAGVSQPEPQHAALRLECFRDSEQVAASGRTEPRWINDIGAKLRRIETAGRFVEPAAQDTAPTAPDVLKDAKAS